MTAKHANAEQLAAYEARIEHLRNTLVIVRDQLTARQVVEEPTLAEPTKEPPTKVMNPNRPTSLEEMVGQEELVLQLRTVIAGAMVRGEKIPHVLLSGAAGLGKTTLAQIIADEIQCEMIPTTGMVLKKTQDLIGLLVKAAGGPAVLFIDEIHATPKAVQETLYTVLEDAKVDMIGGSGSDTVATTQPLPYLVVVGATTAPGKLTVPFRDRFGFQGVLAPYKTDELAEIAGRFWKAHKMQYAKREATKLAERAKGVPRRTIHLAERVLDYCAVQGLTGIPNGTVANALGLFGINRQGLDANDLKILDALTGSCAGRTIGLDALAAMTDLDKTTIEQSHEPYLVKSGLVIRSKTGRMASAAAYELMRGV